MKYQKFDRKSYTVHTIRTDKFKNCTMEIIFRNTIKKEDVTKWNFLIDMLMHSSKKYPKRRDVVIELENLYNTSVRGIPSRIGSCYMVSIVTNFLDPKYCDDGVLKDIIKLPFEMILNPNVENEEFDIRSFNIIKSRIASEIDSVKEQANRFALRSAFEKMDKDSACGISMVGYKEDLERITPSNLYDTYQEFLKNFQCDIFVIGNLDMDEVVGVIDRSFNNNYVKNYEIEMYCSPKLRKKPVSFREYGSYPQAVLVMLYNFDGLTEYEKNIVIHVYNYLLGGGALTTKLGKYLREDNGLCYAVSSLVQKYDNSIVVYAGIDKKNYRFAVRLVKKAVKDMVKGNISDKEFEEAKLALISSLKMSQDTVGGILNGYVFSVFAGVPPYEERLELFKGVSKEDVLKVAHKVMLNIVYLLSEEGE